MPQRSNPDIIRRQAYRAVLQTEQGRAVLDDLVIFAQESGVSEARALGRAEVVLRFERQNKRANEKEEKEENE